MIERAESVARLPRGMWSIIVGMMLVAVLALAGCDVTADPGLGATTGSGTGSGTVTTIPIQVTRGQDNSTDVQVPVYIAGQGPYSFILDTGASISLIDRRLATRLHLPRSGGGQPVVGVGGTEQVVMVQVGSWRAGSASLPATSIAAGAVPSDRGVNGFSGLLGSDIWSRFGKITIDYGASVLTLYGAPSGLVVPGGATQAAGAWDTWRRAS